MITINLGLNNNPYTSKEDIIYFFSSFFIIYDEHLDFQIKESTYVSNNKKITEKTAVFNVYIRYHDNGLDIKNNIKKLCSIFNQDCIAYKYKSIIDRSNFGGRLVYNINYKGKEEDFNLKYFIQSNI